MGDFHVITGWIGHPETDEILYEFDTWQEGLAALHSEVRGKLVRVSSLRDDLVSFRVPGQNVFYQLSHKDYPYVTGRE